MRTSLIKIACIFAVMISGLVFFEKTYEDLNAEDIDYHKVEIKNIEQYREEIEKVREAYNVKGLAVSILDNKAHGETKTYALFGVSDVENQTAVSEETLFRLASISKMFVALSILKLVEEGKLELSDKLVDLAPEIEFSNPWSESDPVRLVHLLENTAGWDDLHLSEWIPMEEDFISSKDFLEIHPHTRTSRWRPGSRFSYTNVGSQVSAYIVEKVSGKSFEDYVSENFFKPLEMWNTSHDFSKAYQQQGASNYSNDFKVPYFNLTARAAAGMNSSAQELTNLALMFLNRGQFKGRQIISEASLLRMEKSFTSLDTAPLLDVGYGLHNYQAPSRTYSYLGHDGSLPGLRTRLSYDYHSGKGYVILMNSDESDALAAIQTLTQNYLARDFQVPDLQEGNAFTKEEEKRLGVYYREASPRHQLAVPITWFLTGHWVEIESDKLMVDSWIKKFFGEPKSTFIKVGDSIARGEYGNSIRLTWYEDKSGNVYLQSPWGTLVSTSILPELVIVFLILIGIPASLYLLLTFPSWFFSLLKRQGNSHELYIHLAAFTSVLIAGLFLLGLIGFWVLQPTSHWDLLLAFGQPGFWSLGIYLSTIAFSLVSVIAFLMFVIGFGAIKFRRSQIMLGLVTGINFSVVCYLFYWDLIGYQTWSY